MRVLVAERNALRINLGEIRARAGGAEIIADLSGDGQGLGLTRMARFLAEEGVQSFAVTDTWDAVNLRRSGFTQEHILMLRSITDLRELRELMDCGVTFAIGSNEAGIALNGLAAELHTVAEARILVDTGLGRYGFLTSETEKMLNIFRQMPGIAVTGMMTRMDSAGQKSTLEARYQAFTDTAQALRAQGADTGVLLALDTCSLFRLEPGEQHAVLADAALIGRQPVKCNSLVKVGSVEATLEELKWLPEGTVLGPGKGKKLKSPTRVAVVDLGWANGVGVLRRPERQETVMQLVRRILRGGQFEPVFRVNGKRAPVLGAVGMTGLVIDVTKCDCNPGDRAVLDADPRLLRFLPVELRA